jgi:hypothetical protein
MNDADLPAHIECPKCGAKNMRTESFCSNCDASLVETKEKILTEIAKSRGKSYESDPFAGEERIGLIPRARTIQFAGISHRVMEGRLVLTSKRMVFAAYKAGYVKSIWGIAGSKGGILGTIASAGSIKTSVGNPNDFNLPPDQLLRAYDGNFQVPYDVIIKVEGETKRDSLVMSFSTKGIYPFTPEKADFTFLPPDELVREYASKRLGKDQAFQDYSEKSRSALEKTLLGAKVEVIWRS